MAFTAKTFRRKWRNWISQTYLPEDSLKVTSRKYAFVAFLVLMCGVALLWVLELNLEGQGKVSLYPLGYGVFCVAALTRLRIIKKIDFVRELTFVLTILLPLPMQIFLGGMEESGFLILWGVIGILGALRSSSLKATILLLAFFYLVGYVALRLDDLAIAQYSSGVGFQKEKLILNTAMIIVVAIALAIIHTRKQRRNHQEMSDKVKAIQEALLVAEYTPEGQLTYINQLFKEKLNINGQNLSDLQHSDIISNDRTPQHESLFWSELQKGKTQQGLYPFRNLKDDKDYWMSGVYSPIYDENGDVQKVYQVMRDMTRERQKNQNYERQIRAFNRFNSIVELNDQGDIIQANANFASLLGFSFIELRDKRYTELFVKEEDRNEFKDYLKAALDGQITQTVHLHTRKDDTPIWIELFYLPLRDYRTKTRSLMLILTDITVRKEYEAKLHKLRNETLATNKQLAEKNDILETATTILDQKNKEIKLQHEEYVKQSQLLEIQNQRVSDSIQYASRIQQSIMTRKEVVESAFEDAFIMLLPRERVSGDFYYFVEVGDRLILVAADCTGHGVPGAFMSLIGHNLLDQMVKMMGLTSPEMMLSGLHMGVQKNLRQKETQNRDGMDIAICCWDRGQQVLEFAGAKNPIFYIQDGEAHLLKGDRTPIGGIQKEKRRMFTKHKIDLKDKETTFYLFSDGFQDQFGGENDRKFGGKRFRALLESIHTLPMKEQQEILLQTHDNWRGDGSQLDDILVTGIKISG